MTSAIVLVNCRFPFDSRIVDKIAVMPHVSTLHRTKGRYDLILQITEQSDAKLQELISMYIEKIPGVDAAISLTVAKEHLAR
ncbi:MAG TPA: Lrp/AsnC ligand binding domain-containing protein [Nitrososphaera sp.]|jgi:DNA-binding Lrp family transcriptional regulator